MAADHKKKKDDFDMFATADTGSRRRRVAAAPGPQTAGGPSGPAMSGGPSGPAMSGSPQRGAAPKAAAPVKRRRRSADDSETSALY